MSDDLTRAIGEALSLSHEVLPQTIAVRCPGCGQSFRGERGLRAHQSRRFVTIACRPIRQEK